MKKLISWIKNLIGGAPTRPSTEPHKPKENAPLGRPSDSGSGGQKNRGHPRDEQGQHKFPHGNQGASTGNGQRPSGKQFAGQDKRRGKRKHRTQGDHWASGQEVARDIEPAGNHETRGNRSRSTSLDNRPSWKDRQSKRTSGFPGNPEMPDPEHWIPEDDAAVTVPRDFPFRELEVSEALLKAVVGLGYEHPTPIQAQAIPAAMTGRDLVGASQTGTGKTAAFALPILTKLGTHGPLRCLILEPTRELAAQVEEALIGFSRFTDIRITLLHGGVGYGTQTESLRRGVDIVVATPGRLLDHLERGTLRLDQIDYLVLDEVDRMLDMGFLPDVRRIVEQCKPERQTLFFSATMPPQIEGLASFAVKDPVRIEIGQRFSPAETVSHAFYPVASDQRDDLLLALLKATDYHSVMIFTRTKAEADQIYSLLRQDPAHNATVLHSDIKQADRTRALQGFRQGEFDVIVATDVAARGLDISDVTHVINYRVPENPEDYVHRIGRTGRASKEGDAFTLLSGDEIDFAKAVERLIGQKIERRKLEGFTYLYTALLDEDLPKDKKSFRRALGHTGGPGGGKKRRR